MVSRDSKVQNSASCLFWWLLQDVVIWPRLDELFLSQSFRGVCVSHSPGVILDCNIEHLLHGQTFISCNILMDHLVHLTLSVVFAAFAYFAIDRFVSINTSPTSAVLLHLIYSCFDKISSDGVVLCYYKKRFTFSLKVSLT